KTESGERPAICVLSLVLHPRLECHRGAWSGVYAARRRGVYSGYLSLDGIRMHCDPHGRPLHGGSSHTSRTDVLFGSSPVDATSDRHQVKSQEELLAELNQVVAD